MRYKILLSILIGLAAGFGHVLTGPDHLAATAPLAIKANKPSWLIGFRWGLGHTLGVIVVGTFALLLSEYINVELLSSYSERAVGLVLILIGLWGLSSSFKKKVHSHTHDEINHLRFRFHKKNKIQPKSKVNLHKHIEFNVGIVHGLAGSSHIFGVLPALAFPTMLDGLAYLLFFGIGTITAMMFFSMFISFIRKQFEQFGIKSYRFLQHGFNSLAILIGFYWLFII